MWSHIVSMVTGNELPGGRVSEGPAAVRQDAGY